MFVRNVDGKIVYFNSKRFVREYDKYTYLWKLKYNMIEKNKDILSSIINYVHGKATSI